MRRPVKAAVLALLAILLATILVVVGWIPAGSPLISYQVAATPGPTGGSISVSLTSHRPFPIDVNLTAFPGTPLDLAARPVYFLEDRTIPCYFGSYNDLVGLQGRLADQLAEYGSPVSIRVVDAAQLTRVVTQTPNAVVLDLECGVLPVTTLDPQGSEYVGWLHAGGVLLWAGGPLGFYHQDVQPAQNLSVTYPGWQGQQILCGYTLSDPTPIVNKGPESEPGLLVGNAPSSFATGLGLQYGGVPYGANLTQLVRHGGVDIGIDAPPNGSAASPRTSLAVVSVGNGTVIYFGGALWPFAGPYLANGGTDLGYDLPLLLALGVRPSAGPLVSAQATLPAEGSTTVQLQSPGGVLLIRVDLVQTTPYLAVVALGDARTRARGNPNRAAPALPADPSMLRATFAHLPEIGVSGEPRLWQIGIRDWSSLARRHGELGFSSTGHGALERALAASEEALRAGDVGWFASRLPPSELWRLYPAFRTRTAFLDIETTSLSPYDGIVTVVTIHGSDATRSFVADEDLEELPAWLARYRLLVTFNGRYFDIPYLQYRFPALSVPPAHIDLRFVLYRLGISGGLKRIEQRLGLGDRTGVEGIAGLEAVHLWARYRAGNAEALERLIDYNRADTVNLEPLTEYAVRELTERLLARGLATPAT